jgi:pyruvate,water dikinase
MQIIIFFNENRQPKVEQVGGKALALMKMTGAGMPVPPGFTLTVDYFEPWIDTLRHSPEWTELTKPEGGEIGKAAKTLQGLCGNLQFTEHQKSELGNALKTLQETSHGNLYAVRSSSPEEDLEGASFAGGYETTLGVTVNLLESAIRHSFTSSFDERIFYYKKEQGFRPTSHRRDYPTSG